MKQTKFRKHKNCKFYLNNHEVKMFQILEKETHIIHFRSTLKDGQNNTMIMFEDSCILSISKTILRLKK
jgi:hypothetical protein